MEQKEKTDGGMRQLKRWNFGIWCALTEKRILMNPVLICVFLAVLLLAAFLKDIFQERTGLIKIGLYNEVSGLEPAQSVIRELMTDYDIIEFTEISAGQDPEELLRNKTVDAIWCFPANYENLLQKAAEQGYYETVVKIMEREDSFSLKLAREVLYSRLYPQYLLRFYRNYVRERIGVRDAGDDELTEEYRKQLPDGELFEADVQKTKQEQTAYLIAPMRGLLAIWMVLAGFAAVMFTRKNEGMNLMLTQRKRIFYSCAAQMIILIHCGALVLAAYGILGIFRSWHLEILSMLLLIAGIHAFCNVTAAAVRRMEVIGGLLPLLVLLMLVICPVFWSIRRLWMIQWIFPPTFYLRSLTDRTGLWNLALYALVGNLAATGMKLVIKRE